MPQLNHQTTAEHIVGCVDATVSYGRAISPKEAADFLDIQERQAEAALEIATELRLLKKSAANFEADSPLCRFLATSSQNIKAAIVRIVLESYEPFTNFRQRFQTTLDLSIAAKQTKAQLSLGASRDEVKDTLVSLGTFSQVFLPSGGGQYNILSSLLPESFAEIAGQAINFDAAAQRIRVQLGPVASAAVDEVSVITPLADALIRARNRDGRGAVVEAGNAIESYITGLAITAAVNLGNSPGLGSKLDKFVSPVMKLPKKLVAVGKYLSNVRNAADHGIDAEIGKMWEITESTGLEYVFVACTFIRTSTAHVSSAEGII